MSKKKRFSWKSSYRAIPPHVKASLSRVAGDFVLVAATKKIPVQNIIDGGYAHVGLRHDGAYFDITTPTVPPADVGLYATRNRFGWEVKRTDLPMITKTFSWETPNFGDASTYGTHTHYQEREVYQREIFEPRMFGIKVELMNRPDAGIALIKFEVDHILDKTSDTFEEDLLFCVNLLQESTGVSDVYASTASREEFIGTTLLDWEVFPPGKANELLASLRSGRNALSVERANVAAERLEVFNELPVEGFIRGSGSFGTYIGAKYADDLVVFENMKYGNALYILYDDWQDVSKRSRIDLLRGTTARFDRVVHKDDWEDRFKDIIEAELRKRGRSIRKK